MSTPLIPQEVYLLERYCSLERYGEMRDAWQAMLDHVERMLNRFMQNAPKNYRKRPRPEQPDIVWGERVLPNFRDTMHILNDGYIKRAHGDYEALGRSCGITGDVRGQRDYWADWMDEVEPGATARYYELLFKADNLADPVDRTSSGIWRPGALTTRYAEVIKEPLTPPSPWPSYRLNPHVRVRSGERTPQTGIYLPDADHGFPTLLLKSDDPLAGEANEALVVIDPSLSEDREYRPVLWTLVERVTDESDIPSALPIAASASADNGILRAKAGEPCPRAGIWKSIDAKGISRTYKDGEMMDDLGSSYGLTVWQWIE